MNMVLKILTKWPCNWIHHWQSGTCLIDRTKIGPKLEPGGIIWFFWQIHYYLGKRTPIIESHGCTVRLLWVWVKLFSLVERKINLTIHRAHATSEQEPHNQFWRTKCAGRWNCTTDLPCGRNISYVWWRDCLLSCSHFFHGNSYPQAQAVTYDAIPPRYATGSGPDPSAWMTVCTLNNECH